MAYQYKRRRRSLIRNFWVYRRLIGSAVLLGIMLWFIWANNTAVTVAFPFRLGHLNSSLGMVILLSAVFGSLVTFLIMTVVMASAKNPACTGHGRASCRRRTWRTTGLPRTMPPRRPKGFPARVGQVES